MQGKGRVMTNKYSNIKIVNDHETYYPEVFTEPRVYINEFEISKDMVDTVIEWYLHYHHTDFVQITVDGNEYPFYLKL